MSASDEFDEFDLSEFTPEEFTLIDTNISHMLTSVTQTAAKLASSAAPAVEIVLESEADTEPSPKAQDLVLGVFQPATKDSPYARLSSRKKSFAVTELVFPLWCEVQYEYGLWGESYRRFDLRPKVFKARSGKTIRVQRDRAFTSNRRLIRGKSTHQALENENRPVKVVVRPETAEERFGLRLVQLITGFNEIIITGKTRELPIFGIIYGYPVLGDIDEVVKVGVTDTQEESSNVDEQQATEPSSHVRKKQRTKSPSPSERPIFNSSAFISNSVTSTHQADILQFPDVSTEDAYALRLIDYKTRRAAHLPPEEDSVSPKLQLMLYHHMLTSLLTPEAIDFEGLWRFLEVDPTKPFSPAFVRDVWWKDSTPEDLHMDLHYLVSEWVSIIHEQKVELGRLQGVNAELQLIYRRPLEAGGSQNGGQNLEINEPLDALALLEEQNVTRAIADQLRGFGRDGKEADDIAREVIRRIRAPYPPECSPSVWSQTISSGPEQDDVHLAWAIQESLLSRAEDARKAAYSKKLTTDSPGDISRHTSGPLQTNCNDISKMSPIIGTRKFLMDDSQLEAFLHDSLQWWLGGRPAKGATVAQTYRCFTCEYHDSCEWREQKAKEAAVAWEKKQLSHV